MLTQLNEEEDEAGNVAFDEKWEEVNEFDADGTLATITDLMKLAIPKWIDPDDSYNCKIALQFQYLIDARLPAALPDDWMELLK